VSALATRRRGGQLALGTERTRRENFDPERLRRERSNCSDGGRLTLEQRLDGVWEGLRAAGVAECPVCGSRMETDGDGVGSCGGCGTTLS
jgi:ribosomal protein L37AE/L43A